MIAVDTDVLAVYYIFKWDKRYSLAARVIEGEKATTAVNALELASIMSIAQGGARARQLFLHLHKRFKVLYWRAWPEQSLFTAKALEYITSRSSPLNDALIGWILEDHGVETLITWNKKHYENRYSFTVETPEEYLAH